MNKFIFCPECGTKVLVGTQFCPNCGHHFDDNNETDSKDISNSSASSNNDSSDFSRDNVTQREQNSFANDDYRSVRSSHNNGKTKSAIIIICLVILAIGVGAFGYKALNPTKNNNVKVQHNYASSKSKSSSSSNSESSSSSSSSNTTDDLSFSEAKGIVSDVFSYVGQSVEDNDAPDYSQSFVNGEANSSYQDLASWAHLQSKNTDIGEVDISVEDFQLDGNKAKFKAAYDFATNSDEHVQVYIWNVTFKKQDGNWLIDSCKSDNKAVADYDK